MFKKRILNYLLIALIGLLIMGGIGFIVVDNSTQIQLIIGERYLTRLDYDKAIPTYEKVISKDSENTQAYLGLSMVYIGLDDLDQAEEILQIGIAEIEDGDELNKQLEFVRNLKTVFNFNNTTLDAIEEVESESLSSEEDNQEIKTQFVNNLDININDYEEFERQNFDLNQDSVEETILLIGRGNLTYLDESYIVVLDNQDNILTIAQGTEADITFGDFEDLNGDGVAEIIMYCSWGGSAGGWNRILEFVDGTYQEMNYSDRTVTVESSFVDDFKYVITYTVDGEQKVAETFLLYDQLDNLKDSGVYDTQGNLTLSAYELNHSMGYFLEDVNGDGIKQYIDSYDVSVTCNACSEVIINAVHEYMNGKLQVKEFYIHSALENYGSSYSTYQQVQAAKQLIYNKFEVDETKLELRFLNDDSELSKSYYVFSIVSDPYSSTPKKYSERLLVEKRTNQLFYLSNDEQIIELN